ncbi:hypothetical protein C4587_00510 [Candidatus Parcubacteria bacterium]|nr:MAG: hypothetical protein C4587_00510 [Candidatus Parcubacteria bacterium]
MPQNRFFEVLAEKKSALVAVGCLFGVALALPSYATTVSPGSSIVVSGEIEGGMVRSGSSGLRSGWTDFLPQNAVVVEIGYGSDDHDYNVQARQGSFYRKSDGTWGVQADTSAQGLKQARNCCEERGHIVTNLMPPTDSFLTRWGWDSSHTSGGRPGSDTSPSKVCVHAKYQLYDPATFALKPGEFESGNCSSRGYQVPGWIRGLVRADPGKFLIGVEHFGFGNDAKLRGASLEYRTVKSSFINAEYVSHSMPTTLAPNTSYTGQITFRNSGDIDWISDKVIFETANCANYEASSGAGECHDTRVVGSSEYGLERLDSSPVTVPTPVGYQRTIDITYSSEYREIACDEVPVRDFDPIDFAPIFLEQKPSRSYAGLFRGINLAGAQNCPLAEWVTVVSHSPFPTVRRGDSVTFPVSFTTTGATGQMDLVFQLSRGSGGATSGLLNVAYANGGIPFGNVVTIPVTVVPPLSGTLEISKQQFTFASGGATSDSALISNIGGPASGFTVTCSATESWLVVDTCPPGPYVQGTASESQSLSAHVDTDSQTVSVPGSYGAQIRVDATPVSGTAVVNSSPQFVNVSYIVSQANAASLDVSKQQFVFDSDGTTDDSALIMNIGNPGSSFTATCSANEPWIIVDDCPAGPYVAGQSSENQLLLAHADVSHSQVASAGSYSSQITVAVTPAGPTQAVNGSPKIIDVLYTVSAGGGGGISSFSLGVLPSSRTVEQGSSTSYAVTAAPSGNFSGAITLGTAGLPLGVATNFTPQTIHPDESATLDVSVAGFTAPATYQFNVTGRSGSIGDSFLAELIVTSPGLGVDPNDPGRVQCSFVADPSIIVQPATSSVLMWNCQNASSCDISQGLGGVDPAAGSALVAPTSTTTYVLFCSNSAGSLSIPAEVQVFSSGRVEVTPR